MDKPWDAEHVKLLKAAARLYIINAKGMTIAQACRQAGVGDNRSDHKRVSRMIKGMKDNGTARVLAAPALRERVVQPIAAVPAAAPAAAAAAAEPRQRGDVRTGEDAKAYAKAYMMIGQLMGGPADTRMAYAGAARTRSRDASTGSLWRRSARGPS